VDAAWLHGERGSVRRQASCRVAVARHSGGCPEVEASREARGIPVAWTARSQLEEPVTAKMKRASRPATSRRGAAGAATDHIEALAAGYSVQREGQCARRVRRAAHAGRGGRDLPEGALREDRHAGARRQDCRAQGGDPSRSRGRFSAGRKPAVNLTLISAGVRWPQPLALPLLLSGLAAARSPGDRCACSRRPFSFWATDAVLPDSLVSCWTRKSRPIRFPGFGPVCEVGVPDCVEVTSMRRQQPPRARCHRMEIEEPID